MADEEQVIIQNLNMEFGLEQHNSGIEQFLGALQQEIKRLLVHDTEKLRWILYRIDVAEKLAGKAMEQKDIDLISASLTQLIYNRQLEKLKTRGASSGADFLDL